MPIFLKRITESIDWILFLSVILVSVAGLLTLNSFVDNTDYDVNFRNLFNKQLIWLSFSVFIFFIASLIDWRFLRKSSSVFIIFISSCFVLLMLFISGSIFKGARSWFDLGFFAFQPVDLVKIVLVLVLAKYFSRRHIEIANIRHIFVSGFYAFILFLLVLLQPDFGSAIIIFFIWLSVILISGVSKKHLLMVFLMASISFSCLWFFGFKDYQKARIRTFIDPLTDIRGAGYNVYQSVIAVGSGGFLGKGIGLGSQSKLQFLPEYETAFIFAAFSEERGLVGVVIIIFLYGVIFFKILNISKRGASNFETFYGLGLLSIFISHFIIHVGMNIGLMPVTGITMPFMSYGGSHLVAEFLGLGILMGMKNYSLNSDRALFLDGSPDSV